MAKPTATLKNQLEAGKLISNFVTNTDKTKSKAKQTKQYLKSRLALLETYWNGCRDRHLVVCEENEALTESHEYFTESLYFQYEAEYIEAQSELATRLEVLDPPPQPSAVPEVAAPQAQGSKSELTPLKIPTFSGEQRDWEPFKEMFVALVVNKTQLDNTEKLKRLLMSVDGKAKARLQGIPVVGTNWDVTWNILLSTYDNCRIKLADQMGRVLAMSTAGRSASDINVLVDTVEEARRSFTALDRPVESWDDWFVHLIEMRLDEETKTDWEKSIEGEEGFPTYAVLKKFLDNRCRTLMTAVSVEPARTKCSQKPKPVDSHLSNPKKNSQRPLNAHSTQVHQESSAKKPDKSPKVRLPCVLCKDNRHYASYCPKLINSDNDTRWSLIRKAGLCSNCLRTGHGASSCPSPVRCQEIGCGELHHTSLHKPRSGHSSTSNTSPMEPLQTKSYHAKVNSTVTLLATARVVLETAAGETLLVRALLDPGSEVSFVSERVVQALRLVKKRSCIRISGVGGETESKAIGEVNLSVKSNNSHPFKLHFTALVVPRCTASLPGKAIENQDWKHVQGLELADPMFHIPGAADCLLGADVYNLLILEGLAKGEINEPVAQNTVFGWVLTGPTGVDPPRVFTSAYHVVRCHHASTSCCQLRDELRRFWELEEVLSKPVVSDDDRECEEHFVRTHSRDETGRYVLRLPFNQQPEFPGIFGIAKSQLLSSERRYHRKPAERQAYINFMKEYSDLGHLEIVPDDEIDTPHCYYIPHHAVFKSDGSGKIRVVYNASQEAENQKALNKCLRTGRKVQTDMPIVASRWRCYRFVFSADIIKMFRQFKIHHEDTDWLRILWRECLEEAIQHLRLTTVTYGTACAPFQAIRALHQLAADERNNFPLGAAILENNMYVDDAFAGADTLEEALEAREQFIKILASAGMELDKWSANHNALLTSLNDVTTQERHLSDDDVVSTLGLLWIPRYDCFCFRVQALTDKAPPTKRGLLSTVARLFDPIGWLAPILIRAKILIQQLWIQGYDWDQDLTESLLAEWTAFHKQLQDIERIRIPRFFGCGKNPIWFLHGFSDASEQAYAAALYFVTQDENQRWMSSLIMAKSKVSPIKTVSVPRLELCGAQLLARLIASLNPHWLDSPARTFCWSDSTVTLAWIHERASNWKTFVATRVGDIQTLVPDASWHHVASEDNPADCASRGLSPEQLQAHALWWKGPAWLCKDWMSWTPPVESVTSNLERRPARPVVLHATLQPLTFEEAIHRHSSLGSLTRIYAYVLRFVAMCRPPLDVNFQYLGKGLAVDELNAATRLIIRRIQGEFFKTELDCIEKQRPLPRKSPLRPCLPFIDQHGILRLGGRLNNFGLSFDEAHPVLVPLGSHLTRLIIRDAHYRTLHGGPQLVLSYIRRRYWIPRVRNTVRQLVRKCIRCIRFQGKVEEQQMAPLPALRGQPCLAFTTCGLDYAGPFPVRTSKGRGQKSTKGYVCLFVCFATRAIHLEVVSDMTTKTFLDAFNRFTSRRGKPHTVFSDNGTTFQGASAELRRLFDSASSFSKDVADAVALDGINWEFIPPRAPHFGGLWEAGVKSFKHHLKRVLGDATLTFEEFSTLTAQIEACLNSRPISQLSNNPEDVTALTPGHFLVGKALTAVPEPSHFSTTLAGVARYQYSTVMRNHFWDRWRREVMHQHQLRSKWLNRNSTLKEGDLVLITDINLPATKWPLARVLRLHAGRDGLPRVATVKTATSTLDRPFVKLIRLPVDNEVSDGGFPDYPMAGGLDSSTASGSGDETPDVNADVSINSSDDDSTGV